MNSFSLEIELNDYIEQTTQDKNLESTEKSTTQASFWLVILMLVYNFGFKSLQKHLFKVSDKV